MHNNATYNTLKAKADVALRIEWGTDEQIDAQNEFFAELEHCVGVLGPVFDHWALKATTDEMVTRALEIAEVRLGLKKEKVGDLIEEYTLFTRLQDHPQLSADELLCELQHKRDALEEDIKWLSDFIKRWEEAE